MDTAPSGFGRRLLAVVIDAVVGLALVCVLFFALANELASGGFDSWGLEVFGDQHYLYVKSGDTVHEVHDEEFWAVAGTAVGYAALVFVVLRLADAWTPGRALANVQGRKSGAPTPPAAMPPGAPPPEWDPVRGTYLQWDPAGGRWLAWSEGERQWKPIGP